MRLRDQLGLGYEPAAMLDRLPSQQLSLARI